VVAGALAQRPLPVYREISRFPAVVRDVALLVKQSIGVQSLIDVFQELAVGNPACQIMQHIVLFDEYRGKGLAEDEKSLAFRITMQDTQTTLHDEAVDTALAAFVEAAHQKFGAILRK
jgi:phenylalanyl-tRNA synthetase beta chain